MKNTNPIDHRKRKALLMLPLVVIPFLTMAFWALGGGNKQSDNGATAQAGLNMSLPPAQLKTEEGDKMSFYDAAQRAESANGISDTSTAPPSMQDTIRNGLQEEQPHVETIRSEGYNDPHEAKIYQKLAEINQQLAVPATASPETKPAPRSTSTAIDQESLNRLETMIRAQNQGGGDDDPELESLNGMMDKILDIQHPERVRERRQQSAKKSPNGALPAIAGQPDAFVSLLGHEERRGTSSGFYGLDSEAASEKEEGTIEAVVHGTQNVVSGSVVKLRLLQELSVNSRQVPKGAFVFGIITLNGERAEMAIQSIQYGGSLYPVNLEVYDLDGMPGIYIPGAITRDAAKASADGAAQNLDISLVDPSLKGQAASAGISSLKTLLSRKTKLVRMMLKSGYRVFLKNKI